MLSIYFVYFCFHCVIDPTPYFYNVTLQPPVIEENSVRIYCHVTYSHTDTDNGARYRVSGGGGGRNRVSGRGVDTGGRGWLQSVSPDTGSSLFTIYSVAV